MKEYKFRYGNTSVSIPVDESQVIGVIEGNDTTPLSNISGALMDAIDNPIDSAPLSEVAAKASSIAIIVSDMTRYWMRQDLIVPLIVEYLVEKCGKSYEDLTIVIATGTHVGGSEEDPCAIFRTVQFPMEEFFPPNTTPQPESYQDSEDAAEAAEPAEAPAESAPAEE